MKTKIIISEQIIGEYFHNLGMMDILKQDRNLRKHHKIEIVGYVNILRNSMANIASVK